MSEQLIARLHLPRCPSACSCRGRSQLERVEGPPASSPELAPGYEVYQGLDELTVRRLEGDR